MTTFGTPVWEREPFVTIRASLGRTGGGPWSVLEHREREIQEDIAAGPYHLRPGYGVVSNPSREAFLFGWLPMLVGSALGIGVALAGTVAAKVSAAVVAAVTAADPRTRPFGMGVAAGLLIPQLFGSTSAQLGAGVGAAGAEFVGGPKDAFGFPWGIFGLVSPMAGWAYWAGKQLLPGGGPDPHAAGGAAGGLMLRSKSAYWKGFGAGALVTIILTEFLD